jgi:hypothetical protein
MDLTVFRGQIHLGSTKPLKLVLQEGAKVLDRLFGFDSDPIEQHRESGQPYGALPRVLAAFQVAVRAAM